MSSAIRILQGSFGRVALLDVDKPLAMHAHQNCHILIKASGVDTYFRARNEIQPLTGANAVLVNAWEPHAYWHHRDGGPHTVLLALYLECQWLTGLHRQLAVSNHPQFFPRSSVPLSLAIRRLADDLANEMLCLVDIPRERLETDLAALVIAVLDQFSEWHNAASLFRADRSPPQDARIKRAINFMRDHLGEDTGMDEIASKAGLSRAHFFTLFRHCTNLTPMLYINVLRMEAAMDGLAGSEVPVGQLAYRLGFSAQSHFTRFFRHHLGITPTDYRRKANVYSLRRN